MANPQRPLSISETSKEIKKSKRASALVNLPEDVLENVFSFLPIKDAVEAGTVSTRFKKSWRLNRKFLFGRDFALRYSREDLTALVDCLFESHRGTQIQSFQLHIDPIDVEDLIEKWLRICIRKDLEDLEFYFFQPCFTLDPSLLNGLKKLRTLKLVYCEIMLPPMLNGLRFLQTLVLWQLEQLTADKLEFLVFHCRLLTVLDLFHCSGIRQINIFARNHRHFKMLKIASCTELAGIEIDSPTLRSIFYCGYIPRILFAQGMTLDEAFFNFTPRRYNYMQNPEVEVLVNDLHSVRILSISALFLEGLVARVRNGGFREAQYRLLHLTELQLFMEGGTFCNPYDIAVFLRNCPSLERLFIDLNDYHFDCGMYWELHQKPMLNKFNHYFTRLRTIKIKGFKFLRSELALVKIILERAIFLELLVFITPKNGRTKLHPSDAPKYNKLLHSWKASPTAKIVLYEHFNDKSSTRASHPKYWY